jgi:hypothetical protein
MKPIATLAAASLLLCIAPGVALAASVHPRDAGSTATATPSPTATATPVTAPDAATVMASAKAAVKQANTFHLISHIQLAYSGLVNADLTAEGDVNLSQKASQVHVGGSLAVFGKAKKVNEDDIEIGKKSWTKSKKTKNVWKANKDATSVSVNTSGTNPLKVQKGDKVTGLTDAGAETLGTTAVWHLTGTYTTKIDATHTAKGTIDYFIGQADNLPYEVHIKVKSTAEQVAIDLDDISSNFGESLTISAPTVGSGTP